jgi:hypothetical protein
MKCCAAIRAIVHCFVTETPISKLGNDEAATKPWPRVPAASRPPMDLSTHTQGTSQASPGLID